LSRHNCGVNRGSCQSVISWEAAGQPGLVGASAQGVQRPPLGRSGGCASFGAAIVGLNTRRTMFVDGRCPTRRLADRRGGDRTAHRSGVASNRGADGPPPLSRGRDSLARRSITVASRGAFRTRHLLEAWVQEPEQARGRVDGDRCFARRSDAVAQRRGHAAWSRRLLNRRADAAVSRSR
jgi:hypothetical protein